MFELDYLTQRLTFTRRRTSSSPRLIAGYAPTFEGDVVELPVATGEPLAAELDAFLARRPRRAAGRSSTSRTACGPSPSPRAPRGRRRRPAGRPSTLREAAPRMSIADRPTRSAQPARRLDRRCRARACRHGAARPVAPWTGEPGTAGHGRGRRCRQDGPAAGGPVRLARLVRDRRRHRPGASSTSINDGPLARRRGAGPRRARRARPTPPAGCARPLDGAAAAARGRRRRADRAGHARRRASSRTTATWMPRSGSIAPGVHAGLDGHLRDDAAGRRHPRPVRAAPRGGQRADRSSDDLFVAFSPERLYSGAALRNLATYPKLVGGLGPAVDRPRGRASTRRSSTPRSCAMSSAEAAEFSKLADTTYRDVNIALANEFARYADRVGVDILEVIAAANSQPYSHIHQPGSASAATASRSTRTSCSSGRRRWSSSRCAGGSTTARSGVAIRGARSRRSAASRASPVLVLGLTYRDGVKELAYSRALPLIERLAGAGRARLGLRPAADRRRDRPRAARRPGPGATPSPTSRAIVTQTADPAVRATLDPAWFPDLEVLFDGRNSLRDLACPSGVAVLGIGVPPRGSRRGVAVDRRRPGARPDR